MSNQSDHDPINWRDPESLPERILRAFERHPDWIPTKFEWGTLAGGRLYCCGLTALVQESPDFDGREGAFYIDDRIGMLGRKAFTQGFDGTWEESPDHTASQKVYRRAGKRAWELVKPLADLRRK